MRAGADTASGAGQTGGSSLSERGRLALLARVGELLDEPLRVDERLERLARVVVPDLADWCSIDLRDGRELRNAAVAHLDPRRTRWARELGRRYPPDLDQPQGVGEVLRTGRPELYPEITGELLEARARDAEHLELLRSVGMSSAMILPLCARGEAIGVLTLVTAESGRRYGPEELALAEELARRAAAAVDNAALYEQERRAREAADRERRRLERLQRITAALSRSLTQAEVARVVLEEAAGALLAGSGSVTVLRPDGSALDALASFGYGPELVAAWQSIPLELEVPVCDVVRRAVPVVLESADAAREAYPALAGLHERIGDSAWVALPLLVEGSPIGALFLTFGTGTSLDEADALLLLAIADQCAQALERARLYAVEERARRAAERRRERLSRLQQLTSELARALTPGDCARALLDVATAATGAADGSVHGFEPDRDLLVPIEERGSLPAEPPRADRGSAAEALASERVVTDGAWTFVPLLADGARVGVMLLRAEEEGEDTAFLHVLGHVGGRALARAQRYQREHETAVALQRSLLPERLPELEGLAVAARYLAGSRGASVGGDWYEALDLPGGELVLAVGDVVGRGAEAAAVMGQLRSVLRAFAAEDPSPCRILERVGRFAEGVERACGSTVACCVLDPARSTLTYACAGHPPPLLVRPDGTTEYLADGRSPPLATVSGQACAEASIPFPAGAAVVLYSDGLVERRDEPLVEAFERLAAAARRRAALEPERLLQEVLAEMGVDETGEDDVAVLAVRVTGQPAGHRALTLPARPEELAGIRQLLRDFLAPTGASGETVEEIVLACNEACANAIEHAYVGRPPGTIELELTLDGGRDAVVVVRDFGSWRRATPSPDRGRGLQLIRTLSDGLTLHPSETGTTLTLHRQLNGTGAR